jgi:DNA-binding NarL/FixJ family response regulator
MQTKLLIVCEDESRGLGFSERIAQTATGIAIFTTDRRRLHAEAASISPDVLLVEFSTLGDLAPAMLPALLRLQSAPRILFLCTSCTPELLLSFIRLGACGCILETDPPAVMARAVRSVHEGDTWFGRSSLLLALRSLVSTVPRITHQPDKARLTAREREIYALIGRGMTNKEIARHLDISELTVKTHLHRVYVKLEKSGRYKALLPGISAHAPIKG